MRRTRLDSMTRRAASDEYQFTLAALRVAKNHLWKERHTMPFTFKLSKRLARLKPRAVILALAALVACDQADRSLTSPSHPSFDTNSGNPDGVADLAVAAASDTSIALSFTEVDDGIGAPASYDVRYVVGPSLSWGSGVPSVARGTCAAPVAGTAIGSTRTCTVLGLTAGTTYSFQLVAFRGTLNVNAVFGPLSNVTTGQTAATGSSPAAGECATPQAGWIWCDDFEQNRLGQYFEYDSSSSDFVRAAGVGMDGSYGMRVHFAAGQVSAGSLHLAMGKVPDSYFRTVDAGTAIYRNVYWRMYVRNQTGWSGGGGYKLSRAISFATSNWAEAMMAHVWGDPPGSGELSLDPASGTDAAGNLLTTKYNDFANMRWLGAQAGVTPLFDASHVGQWYCVEAHAQLNDAALSNGVFEFWINGNLEARETGLNWLGSFSAYGINALFFENYWNTGSPVAQERYFDNIVISTQPIGCVGSGSPPPPPPPAPVAQVVVSPASASDTVGLKQQFTTTMKDSSGNVLSGRTVTWASNNHGVATVDANGLGSGVAAGTATITATSEGVNGSATVTVTTPTPTVPGTVSDLTIVGSTDSSVTLSFTEVNDGTGKPASYDVRSTAGASLTWSLAKSVTQGSCATPVTGTAIGSKRTCTVLGLVASTTYSVELVAFRGTLNVNAVFGDLSNVATGATQSPAPTVPGTVTDLALVGSTDSSVTLSFTEVNDGTGKPASYDLRSMAGSSLTWWLAKSVTQGSCATPVAGSAIGSKRTCTVLGLAAGTTYSVELVAFRGTLNVNAVFGDLSNVATGTTQAAGDPPPPPSQPGTNPNEPAGFQRFGENDFTVPLLDYTAATGLLGLWRAEILDGNNAYVVDAAAPKSPLPVFQGKYPAGWTAGYTPIKWEGWDGAANSLGYGTEMAQLYVSLWIRFPGSDYENQSVGTKFFYIGVGESKASAGNQLYTMLYHPSGAGQTIASNFPVDMEQQSAVAGANNRTEVTASPVFSIGAWHRMEFVLKLNTIGQTDGVFQWWLDGTLVMDYRDMVYVDAANPLGFYTFKFWPYWGGGGGTRTRDDYIQVDHLYLSGIPK